MSKTLTKKELRRPDAFIAIGLKAGKWLEENIKAVLGLLGVALLATVVWFSYGYYQSSKEAKASEALFSVETAALDSISKIKTPDIPNLGEYIATLKAHSNTKTALSSVIAVVGNLQKLEGSEALQKELVEAVGYKPSKKDILYGFSQMTYGHVALQNEDMAGAQNAFKSVISESHQKPLHATALIQLGSIAEKKNELKEARDFYQRVVNEFPDSESKKIAEKLIIHLDLLAERPTQGS